MDDHKIQDAECGGRESEQDKMELALDSSDRVVVDPVSLDDAQWRAKSDLDFGKLQSALKPAPDFKATLAAAVTPALDIKAMRAAFVTPALDIKAMRAAFVTPALDIKAMRAAFVTPALDFKAMRAAFVTPALDIKDMRAAFVTPALDIKAMRAAFVTPALDFKAMQAAAMAPALDFKAMQAAFKTPALDFKAIQTMMKSLPAMVSLGASLAVISSLPASQHFQWHTLNPQTLLESINTAAPGQSNPLASLISKLTENTGSAVSAEDIAATQAAIEAELAAVDQSGNTANLSVSAKWLITWLFWLVSASFGYLALQNGVREELCFLQPKIVPGMTSGQLGKAIRSAACEVPGVVERLQICQGRVGSFTSGSRNEGGGAASILT